MQWTPTLLILDPEGTQRHRFEGYLPAAEFLAQLHIGLAHAAFSRKQWDEAERRYRQVVEQFPTTEAAPQALYWSGVAKYKAGGNPAALAETAQQFKQSYTESAWAKKASVWASGQAAGRPA